MRILIPPAILHRIPEGSISLLAHTPKATGLLSIARGALRCHHLGHLGMKGRSQLGVVIW